MESTVDFVDTTMFPLQATMFFSNNRALFNGFVFARAVWSCAFFLLDQGRDGGPPSIHHLIRGQRQSGRLCAPVCGFCRWYHFPLCILSCLCCKAPSPLLSFPLSMPLGMWHAYDCLLVLMFQCIKKHRSTHRIIQCNTHRKLPLCTDTQTLMCHEYV